tara:strand:- start:1616 stop:4096 length:2481 start_codon:yes stop_codon:yes gene_type:complete
MSYANVLRGLTAGEETNVNRKIRNDNILISNQRERNIEKLQAISFFSKSLDGFVKDRVEKTKKEDIERGKIQAIEEDLESREGIGITQIPPEEEQQYYVDKESVITNKKQLNETANSVIEEGGSFQDGKDISNLSGWALYAYVQQKSRIAADGYEGWLAGEMKDNDDLQLEYKGTTFTPSTAETLSQKAIALKALRRRYLVEQGLLDVNRSLLNDKDVGFYDKVLAAHTKLTTQYETAQDIDDGIRTRQNAVEEFTINKDFGLLLGEIKRTRKTNGTSYNRKEALDETFKILKSLALTGDITIEDLEEIQEQEIEINGETYKAGRWRTRWAQLAIDITEANEAAMDAEQAEFEMQGEKYIMDIQAKEKKLNDEGKRFTEEEIKEFIQDWDPKWGKPHTYLTDYLSKNSAEDENDDDIIETFRDNIQKKKPIYQTDVNRIQDFEKWKTWTKLAKEAGNADLLKAEKGLRDKAVKGLIETTFFDTVENPKGTKWEAANTQAIERYDNLYEKLRGTFETSRETHNEVMKILSKEIEKNPDNFTKWEWERDEGQSRDQKYFRNKQLAQEAIKIDSDYIVRSVIPGTEEALETYIKSGGNTVPQIYEDLSVFYNKNVPANKAISPSELAYRQSLTVDKDVENIQTEISAEIEELEKLEPHVRATLLRHPDQFKVARAKLLALKKDGDISYNDVEYLIDEVVQMDIDKDNKLKPLPQDLKPRIGDWKDVDGIGYVVWDGEEWIRKGMKGRYRKPYLGNVENYRDIDNFVKPYDGKYTGEIPLGAWQKLPNAVGYIVWDGKNWVRSGNKTRAAEYEGEVKELLDLDGEVKQLY